jgi:hypothetical protein
MVEILHLGENKVSASDYLNFTISDDKRVIYTFHGDEVWVDNFLVIELSGLNNDQDSVILQDSKANVLDQMSYTATEKGLSWLRITQDEALFILGEASPNYANPNQDLNPTLIPSPSITPNLSPTPSPQPLITPTPTIHNKSAKLYNNPESQQLELMNNSLNHNQALSQQDLVNNYFANYQNHQNLQISYAQERQFPKSRLVFLGQKILKRAFVDVIIGSSLLVIAAVLLSYEIRKKTLKTIVLALSKSLSAQHSVGNIDFHLSDQQQLPGFSISVLDFLFKKLAHILSMQSFITYCFVLT